MSCSERMVPLKRPYDRRTLKERIAAGLAWAMLVLVFMALLLAVKPALQSTASGAMAQGESSDRRQRPVEPELPTDVGEVNTRTLPGWALEAIQQVGAGAAGDQLSAAKSVATGFGDNSIAYNGQRITYTLTISNPTQAIAKNLLILDVLPKDALTDIECTHTCERVFDKESFFSPLGDPIEVTVTRQISWAIASMAPGGVATRQFSGKVVGLADGTELYNRAFINYLLNGASKTSLSNETETIVRVYIQENGKASLSDAPTWLSSDLGGTLSMDWGDFDGDGDLDLVLGSTVGTAVYRNVGGRLAPYWGNDRLAYGVRWGDFDNDAMMELAAVGDSRNDLGVNYIYDHDPAEDEFTEVEFQSSEKLLRVLPGYYDGDEYLDLIVSSIAINAPCAVLIYTNTMNATQPFSGSGTCVSTEATAAMAPVDHDLDGHLDLTLGLFPNETQILLNNGVFSGTNPLSGTTPVLVEEFATYLPYDYAWGDYNGDGYLDLAAAYPLERKVRIYRYDPWTAGFEIDDEVHTNLFYTPLAVDWGDLNGDGILDLIVADSPPRVYEYRSGSFVEILSLPFDAVRGQVWSIHGLDQDSDGDLDLAVTNRDGPSMVFPNYAPLLSPYGKGIASSGSASASSVAWGDYDGDGDFDLLFGAGPNAVGSKLYLNVYNSDGHFLPKNAISFLASGFGPHRVAFGDVNGDSQLDVALALGGTTALQLYLSGNTDSPDWTSAAPHYPDYSLAWGDADDDGDLDLLVGSTAPTASFSTRGRGSHLRRGGPLA